MGKSRLQNDFDATTVHRPTSDKWPMLQPPFGVVIYDDMVQLNKYLYVCVSAANKAW